MALDRKDLKQKGSDFGIWPTIYVKKGCDVELPLTSAQNSDFEIIATKGKEMLALIVIRNPSFTNLSNPDY